MFVVKSFFTILFLFKMKISLLIILAFFTGFYAFGQQDSTKNKEIVKKGWNFGAVPAIAYDSDLGFRYGGIVNLYNYGDGSTYPKYLHSIYLEWSKTTKGSGQTIISYDSEELIKGIRVLAEARYMTEKALDFYGFNGYEAFYNPSLEDDNHADYVSRMYYRHERKDLRLKLDFQGKLFNENLKWNAGGLSENIKTGTVDINVLNKGQAEENLLPDTALLYDKFVERGVIKNDEKNGGNHNFLRLGVVYDTRDNEPNPMKGIWAEALLLAAPEFMGEKGYGFSRFALTYRQYFTLKKEVLNFAGRVSYQGLLTGKMPFYMLPFVYDTKDTRDGLGGSKTLRGILRNRVVGEDVLFGNFELRWKFYRTRMFKQNFYFAINPFVDMGIVTSKYGIDLLNVSENFYGSIVYKKEKLHMSYGMGLHIAMNQNFIVAIDYGIAHKSQDGNRGLYIGLNFLF